MWLAGAELDVVARRGRTIVFCEVKSKSGTAFGDAVAMVTPEKVRRVRRAAEVWLTLHPEYVDARVRFDVVAVDAGVLTSLPGAF